MLRDLILIFALLVFCHCLADYPLQGDFLAKAKNPKAPIPGVPWWQAMTAHASIHAGFVLLVTGSLNFAAIELVAHWCTDYLKCEGDINFNIDQLAHISLKLLFAFVLAFNL